MYRIQKLQILFFDGFLCHQQFIFSYIQYIREDNEIYFELQSKYSMKLQFD